MRPLLRLLPAALLALTAAPALAFAQEPPVVPAIPPPATAIPPAPPHPSWLYVGGELVSVVGTTPSPSLGFGASIGVRPLSRPTMSLELGWHGTWSPGAAHVSNVAVRSRFLAGYFAFCGHGQVFFFCPTVGVGQLETPTLTPRTRNEMERSVFAVIGARVGAQIRVGEVLVRGSLELDATPGVNANIYVYEKWHPPPFGGVASLGLALD